MGRNLSVCRQRNDVDLKQSLSKKGLSSCCVKVEQVL